MDEENGPGSRVLSVPTFSAAPSTPSCPFHPMPPPGPPRNWGALVHDSFPDQQASGYSQGHMFCLLSLLMEQFFLACSAARYMC